MVFSSNNASVKVLDISVTDNDLIYHLLNHYLTSVIKTPPLNLVQSVNKLSDTIVNYYMVATANKLIDVKSARKILELELIT